MKAKIHVTLKNGVLDPQGRAIQRALAGLGFKNAKDVRQGKFFEIEMIENDHAKAKSDLTAMCEQLLANTVIENFHIEIVD